MFMTTNVLSTNTPVPWDEEVARIPGADVYFSSAYHKIHEVNGDGVARALVCREGADVFFYPLMVRPISAIGSEPAESGLQDVETVYGYSGPITTSKDPDFLQRAWRALAEYLTSERVVAEFIRFHPYMDNQNLAGPDCRVAADRETVSINLEGTEDDLWARYPSGQRTKIRNAQKMGVTVREGSRTENGRTFCDLYESTMRHVKASRYYFFRREYFDALWQMGDVVRLFMAEYEGRIVAAAVFFCSRGRIHYHLGGSDSEARSARPNNLLFHTVACWAQRQGCTTFHLGGGRTNRADDELLRFKASFSRERRVFFTGRRIWNGDTYESFCRQWLRQAGNPDRPDFFLLYRQPLPSKED